jgi:hypothetical protein
MHDGLRRTRSFEHLASTGTLRCFADRAAIATYFGAPMVAPGGPAQTVAAAEGLPDVFPADGPADPAAVPALVDRLQDLGLAGIPDHCIHLFKFVGDGSAPEYSYVLAIAPTNPETGAGLATSPLTLAHLVNHGHPPGHTAELVAVEVAELANRLLATDVKARTALLAIAEDAARAALTGATPTQARDPAAQARPKPGSGYPIGTRARPFPPLSTPDTPPAPGAPERGIPAPGRGSNRR